jgi:hypothetical protein
MALLGASCKGRHSRVTVQNEEDAVPLQSSTVRTGDPKAGAQLLSGFYSIEGNAWRWTAGRFSVLLRTPPGAGQRGGTLAFAFTIPDQTVQKLGNITLTASINGMSLKSAEYHAPGAYIFNADVPASLFAADSVKVDFALDKTMRPDNDSRDLGVVATSVSVSAK